MSTYIAMMMPLHRSLADTTVTELLANLDAQMEDDTSLLRTGNVTSAAKGITYTTSVLTDITSLDPDAVGISLSVVEYQPKGLFGFTSLRRYTTEASESVTLAVQRDHGSTGIMDIGYTTSDGTATSGDEYSTSDGTVRFYHGETTKNIEITLLDDANAEQHFKTFMVELALRGPINEGAAVRTSASMVTVFVYDYGDGIVLANTTFTVASSAGSFPSSGKNPPVRSSAPSSDDRGGGNSTGEVTDNFASGWSVTDNGGEAGWVDLNGYAARDAVVGADEYGACW